MNSSCMNYFSEKLPVKPLFRLRTFFGAAVCTLALASGCGTANVPAKFDPEALVKEKVTFSPEKPERWTLPNGVSVIYRFDDELPSVRARLYFPGGTFFVPPELTGLAEATGSMIREGGFVGMSPDELDKALDDLAASIETSYSQSSGSIGFSSLKEDFPAVLGYAWHLIEKPAFDAKRFDVWKKAAHQSIRRRKDSPGSMAAMLLNEQVYGATSPYAVTASHETLDRISVQTLRDYHRKYCQPKGAIFTVVGDISKEEVNRLLDSTFAKWVAPGAIEVPALPSIPELRGPGIYVLEREFDQSTVIMGHVGPPLPTPELPEMNVFNRLYGEGGFGNLLMQEIRTKLGLAYVVHGAISPSIGAGLVEVQLGTRNEEAVKAVQKVYELTDAVLAAPPAESDLEGAKLAAARAFIFRFDSPDDIVQRAAQHELFGFPKDYDRNYIPKVEAVTPDSALSIGKKWVKPGNFVIAVVGRVPAEKFAEAFKGRGIPVYRVTFDEKPNVVGEVR